MSLLAITWSPKRRDLRRFGVSLFILSAISAAILYWVNHPRFAIAVLAFSAVTCLLAVSTKKGALPIYWLWMGISWLLGLVISPIVFAILYYFVLTPVGLLMRLVGRDRLVLARKQRDTYWRDASKAPTTLERYQSQF